MPRARRPAVRFDDLPLFVASDIDLAEAVVGTDPERRATWLAGLPTLEAHGFPRRTPVFGRYRPAVRAFYDELHSIHEKPSREGDRLNGWRGRR